MVTAGKKVKLLPRMDFKNRPEKFVEKFEGDDKIGHYQEFSVQDFTTSARGVFKGFLIVRFYGEKELNVGDEVEIGEIIGVMGNHGNTTTMVSIAGDDTYEIRRELGF